MSGLYFQSGIDKGFEKDLKRMNKQMNILSRNVQKKGKDIDSTFAKIGKNIAGVVSVTAIAAAGKELVTFSNKLETAFVEVATISDTVTESLDEYKEAILELSTEEDKASESAIAMTQAFYGIVSAGYDGEQGMNVLAASAIAATAGFVETSVAADGLTTVMNAWSLEASEAENVSDVFFKTVEKGKTTFSELGKDMAKVAPLAASMGVSFEEVSAATATMTKQGTKTTEAFTQIKAVLTAMNKVLGDGWSETMTYQEALLELQKRAGGSQNKLQELLGSTEAVAGVLSLTGKNAIGAAEDLEAMNNAIGATEAAAKKVTDTTEHQIKVLKNNILAAFEPLGAEASGVLKDLAKRLNDAFKSGDVQKFAKVVLQLSKAFVVWKVSVIALNQVQKLRRNIILNNVRAMRLSSVTGKTVTAGNYAMAKSFKSLKVAFASNPIGLLVTGLTLAIPLISSYLSKEQELTGVKKVLNAVQKENTKQLSDETAELGALFTQLKATNQGTDERAVLVEKINSKYGTTLQNLSDEEAFLKQIDASYKSILNGIKKKIALETQKETLTALIKEENEIKEKLIKSEKQLAFFRRSYSKSWQETAGAFKTTAISVGVYKTAIEELQKAQEDILEKTSETIAELTEDVIAPKFDPKKYDKSLKDFQKLLDTQKSVYIQYNSDVEGLSNERLTIVSNEYKSLTEQGKTYLAFLEKLLEKEKDAGKKTIIKKQIEDVKFETTIQTQKDSQKILNEQEKELKELLTLYSTYNDKRQKIEGKYQEDIKKLRTLGDVARVNEAKKQQENELKQLDISFAKNNEKFKVWMESELPNIVKEGTKALQTEIDSIELNLTGEGLDPRKVAVYVQQLTELTNKLKEKSKIEKKSDDDWKDIVQLMSNVNTVVNGIIDSFDGLNESTKNVLTGVLEVSSGLVNMVSAFKAVAVASGLLQTASAALLAISATLQVISAVSTVFKKNEEREEEARKARQAAYIREIENIQKINLELIQQNALYKEGNELLSSDRWGTALAGLEAYNKALNIQNEMMEELFEIRVFSGASGGISATLIEAYPDLIDANGELNKSLLETLITKKIIKKTDRAQLENLLEIANKAEEVYGQFGEYISSIFGGVANDITEAFQVMYETGEDAMSSLEDSFSGMIENFTRDAIEFAFLQPYITELNTLTKDLGEQYAKGDVTAEQLQKGIIDALGGFYGELGDLQPIILQAYKDADSLAAKAGFEGAFNSDVAGAIEQDKDLSTAGMVQSAITEETGGLLVGRLGAMMLSNERIANFSADALEYAVQNLVYMKQIKINTDFLPEIASNTRKTYESLQSI